MNNAIPKSGDLIGNARAAGLSDERPQDLSLPGSALIIGDSDRLLESSA